MPAGKKISALSVLTPLVGTEEVPLAIGTTDNKRTTTQAIADLAGGGLPAATDLIGSTGSAFTSVSVSTGLDLTAGVLTATGGGGITEPVTFHDVVTTDFTLASVIGAAIVNAGTGGTPGPATVTGTTGTGTKFQAAVTIEAGGTIDSVDSISVAGAYTVPPTDPTAEPVTGGGLTGATLSLGLSFTPSIVGSDATSGFAFDANGLPNLTDSSSAHFIGLTDPAPITNSAAVLTSPTLIVSPKADVGTGTLYVGAFAGSPAVHFTSAEGTVEGPAPLTSGDTVGVVRFSGFDGTSYGSPRASITALAAENFDGAHRAVTLAIETRDLSQNTRQRVLIDGVGTTKQQNGVFALDTSGSDAGIAIGSLPSSPTLGMMAVVNDALAPAVGVQVAAMGGANALVWWNGAQWTVMGV